MNAHSVTISILVVIGSLLLLGIILRLAKKRTNKLISLLPNIVVSFGILGTFVGVYLGLLEFDVSNINDSIPKILEGLKTAFSTSIAGLVASIILKFIFEGKSTWEDSKDNVARQDDPLKLLQAMVIGIHRLEKSSRAIENSIVSCFRSDEEYSLISQLKLIRQEVVDSKREIVNSFENFANKIAQSNTDALVDALKKVIGDFNTLLNELVSESFKELSVAMIKLTEWQEEYKTQMDKTQDTVATLLDQMNKSVKVLRETSDKITNVDNSLEKIDISVGSISVSADDISMHIANLQLQNKALEQSISSIKQIGDEAKKVIPEINAQINKLTGDLKDTVSTTTDSLKQTTQDTSDSIKSTIIDIKNSANQHTESIKRIDDALDEELTKSLNYLAGSLGALSAKFVEDYQPLTEQLRKIVRLSEGTDV